MFEIRQMLLTAANNVHKKAAEETVKDLQIIIKELQKLQKNNRQA